jgi:hypothetical protein
MAWLCRPASRLLPRALHCAPGLRCSASESYGRRAELYDEDVFDPIDELPLTRRRRGGVGIGWSLAEKTEEKLLVVEKPVELVEDPKILEDPELERASNAREASASGKGVKLGVRPPPPPPLGHPRSPRSVEVSSAPKEPILEPGNEVEDFLLKHGVALEGTAELKPIRSFEEGGFPEQVGQCVVDPKQC